MITYKDSKGYAPTNLRPHSFLKNILLGWFRKTLKVLAQSRMFDKDFEIVIKIPSHNKHSYFETSIDMFENNLKDIKA